jgi:hypothetical protein
MDTTRPSAYDSTSSRSSLFEAGTPRVHAAGGAPSGARGWRRWPCERCIASPPGCTVLGHHRPEGERSCPHGTESAEWGCGLPVVWWRETALAHREAAGVGRARGKPLRSYTQPRVSARAGQATPISRRRAGRVVSCWRWSRVAARCAARDCHLRPAASPICVAIRRMIHVSQCTRKESIAACNYGWMRIATGAGWKKECCTASGPERLGATLRSPPLAPWASPRAYGRSHQVEHASVIEEMPAITVRRHVLRRQKAGAKKIGYCWPTPRCRNLCVQHACFEGKKAGETSLRKSTPRTLKLGRLRARSFRPFLPAPRRTGQDTCRIIRLSGFLVSLTVAVCRGRG